VALNLYRRHRRDCLGGHPEDLKSGEFEERRKTWKRCSCPIFVSGTLQRKFHRQSTAQWEWEDAKATAREIEDAGSWDGAPPIPPQPTFQAQQSLSSAPSVTIEEAIKAFLAEREEIISINTLRKNGYVLKKLKVYAAEKGYVLPNQWQPIDVRQLRTGWGVASNTATTYMEIVKAFFGFCLANKWIEESPAKGVKPVRSKHDQPKERLPFSDAELNRMFDACDRLYGRTPIKWSRTNTHKLAQGEMANYRYRWSGKDLADFIDLGIHTGLRISDLSQFHIDRLQPNGECHIRTTKTGRKVFTWLPPRLQEMVKERAKIHGPLIFGSHTTTNINVITETWRKKLNRLWKLCGPWPEKPHPHRMRHTFARILLERGVVVEDVAQLLGDTPEVVRQHYSAWIPSRQERLSRILQEAFSDRARPDAKVVPIR
jgi:integrase/recombinase XerD